jgi:NadR type nicotinamide-nucleotide adenylyltransferase
LRIIAFTGPESTGKTSIAAAMADMYCTIWVPEYAREYLAQNGPIYSEEDFNNIFEGQQALIERARKAEQDLIFLDTEMLVLKIWSEKRFRKCPPDLEAAWENQKVDFYFLCTPDIPWHPDPLREHPDSRNELFDLYHHYLALYDRPFEILKGDMNTRMEQVRHTISNRFHFF